jgi:hypothetical protein
VCHLTVFQAIQFASYVLPHSKEHHLNICNTMPGSEECHLNVCNAMLDSEECHLNVFQAMQCAT